MTSNISKCLDFIFTNLKTQLQVDEKIKSALPVEGLITLFRNLIKSGLNLPGCERT